MEDNESDAWSGCTQCNVIHMDLMPCNIAWKSMGGVVQVKLLGIDAATNLSFRVDSNMT